jgi:hypothetical protein
MLTTESQRPFEGHLQMGTQEPIPSYEPPKVEPVKAKTEAKGGKHK